MICPKIHVWAGQVVTRKEKLYSSVDLLGSLSALCFKKNVTAREQTLFCVSNVYAKVCAPLNADRNLLPYSFFF